MGLLDTISNAVQSLLVEDHVDPDHLMASHIPAQLSAFLPYRDFDPEGEDGGSDMFVSVDSIGFTVEFQPLTGTPREAFDAVQGLLSTHAPDDVTVQVILHSSPRVGRIYDHWERARVSDNPVYRAAAARRLGHLRKGAFGSLSKSTRFTVRDHRCFVSASLPFDGLKDDKAAIVAALSEYREQIISGLSQSVYTKVLNADDLLALVGEILNPTSEIQPFGERYDAGYDLNRQCVRPDTTYTVFRDRIEVLSVNEEKMRAGSERAIECMEIRTLEARQFPEHARFGDAIRYLGNVRSRDVRHSAPVTTCLTVYFPKMEAAAAGAEAVFMRSKQVSESPIARFTPEVLFKARDWENAKSRLVKGERIVKMSMFVAIMAPVGEGERAERNTRNVFSTAQIDLRRADQVHLPTLIGMLPMVAGSKHGRDLKALRRMRTQLSSVSTVLAPVFAEFLGTSRRDLLLLNRMGQPFCWGTFASLGTGNQNARVIGPSGSGKSFLLNEMVFAHNATGGHALVIDDGRSFENHCRMVGGAHYTFDLRSNFVLNIFDSIIPRALYPDPSRYDDYLNEIKQVACGIFEQMCFGNKPANKSERGVIRKAVETVLRQHGARGGANEVQAQIRAQTSARDVDVDSLVIAMEPYTGDGSYARIFNGRNTLDLSRPLTVFELSPLESLVDLRAVIVTALFAMIDNKVTQNRGREDLVVLDEAWKHLENESLSEVVAGWARRLRKYGAGLIIATQNYQDFQISQAARGVGENCEWTIMLKPKAASVHAAAEDGLFPDTFSRELCQSTEVMRGEFSELMIFCDAWYALGRLVVDPFTGLLYSTDASVVARLDDLQARGLSLPDAMDTVLADNAS